MRTADIGCEVMDLLDEEKFEEAFHLFRENCDGFYHCNLKEDVTKCVKLCLLPKICYLSLGVNDPKLNERYNHISNQI